MSVQNLIYTDEVAKSTASLYEKLSRQYSKEEWESLAPYVYEINRLKKEKNAVILAHNYMTPDIFYGVADFVGDSLMLARKAAKADADIIIQCGVHFMAETAKILCPEKKVIIPDPKAGCSLADAITAKDMLKLKEQYPGVPIITYVNTSAEVKALADVCCTSSNALKIVNALGKEGHKRVILAPDKYLAQNTDLETDVEVILYNGSCEVHEKFKEQDILDARAKYEDLIVLAHPECPPAIMKHADCAGSTAQIDDYIKEHQPKRAFLMTERSMGENIAVANPNVEIITTCTHTCPHMKLITLPKVLEALQNESPEVILDADTIEKARIPVERMLALS